MRTRSEPLGLGLARVVDEREEAGLARDQLDDLREKAREEARAAAVKARAKEEELREREWQEREAELQDREQQLLHERRNKELADM